MRGPQDEPLKSLKDPLGESIDRALQSEWINN